MGAERPACGAVAQRCWAAGRVQACCYCGKKGAASGGSQPRRLVSASSTRREPDLGARDYGHRARSTGRRLTQYPLPRRTAEDGPGGGSYTARSTAVSLARGALLSAPLSPAFSPELTSSLRPADHQARCGLIHARVTVAACRARRPWPVRSPFSPSRSYVLHLELTPALEPHTGSYHLSHTSV